MIFFVFELKPNQRAVLGSLVCLKELEAVAGTHIDEIVLNGFNCCVWHKFACEGAAENRLVLVKDKAANVRTFAFFSDAFINFDLAYIFKVDSFQVGWVVFRCGTPKF
jgi:hypothetical protein